MKRSMKRRNGGEEEEEVRHGWDLTED